MATIEDLKKAGLSVEIAFEAVTVYRVTGEGIDTMVRSDDQDAIDNLATIESHESVDRAI